MDDVTAAPIRRVAVFIPTLDGARYLDEVLDAVKAQRLDLPFTVRAIDSGSTDGTQAILARHEVPFESIDRATFDHGMTRNRGVLAADADAVALLSQDATPADENWLRELLAPLRSDASVAGAYARQESRPGAHPFQRVNLERHMEAAAGARVEGPLNVATYATMSPEARLRAIAFDNVASVVRTAALRARPFPKAMFGEDLAWARAILLSGGRIAYCPRARVLHSHDATPDEFGSRVFATHQVYKRLADFTPFPSRLLQVRRTIGQALRLASAAVRTEDIGLGLRIKALLQALPYAIRQMEAMRKGALSVAYEPPHQ